MYKQVNGAMKHASSQMLLNYFRRIAAVIGKDVLGCEPADIGTHSIRSGGAMAMCLSKTPVYTIMLVGRWSSDAFLRHIQKQVQQFAAGISKGMIQHDECFHIPDPTTVQDNDPRTSGNINNFAARGNMAGGTQRSAATNPLFALFMQCGSRQTDRLRGHGSSTSMVSRLGLGRGN